MSSTLYREVIKLPFLNTQELANLCGVLHSNIKFSEKHFHFSIKLKEDTLIVHGSSELKLKKILDLLYPLAKKPIETKTVRMLASEEYQSAMTHLIKLSRKTITARNNKQAAFLKSINDCDITCAVGPAGTGDMTQIDLPQGIDSGLVHAVYLLKNIPEISINTFTNKEVVRHPLVSKIVDCYSNDVMKNKK